jgi:signal transduction histidine kinase/ActR/RegA family two-component response regulator/uncharacterized protein YdeI (BOF family)
MLAPVTAARRGRSLGCTRAACWLTLLGATFVVPAAAAEQAAAETSPPLVTQAGQLWNLSPAQKEAPVSIRLEGRVSYYDPLFRLSWLEADQVGTYVLLGTEPPPLRTGQRVRIEGTLVMTRGLEAARTKVTVLDEYEPITPLETAGRIADLPALADRIVAAEGYVDSQQYVDSDHVRLSLIIDDRPVIGWVKPFNPALVPNWTGRFVRLEALYSARFDPTNTATTIELWSDEARLKVLGTREDNPRFNRPRTPVNAVYRLAEGTPVLVRGQVETHDAGTAVTLRDETGQIAVYSLQRERLPYGQAVEASGTVARDGARWVLRGGLYRVAPAGAGEGPPPSGLRRVEQIRELSLAQAERGQPVRIAGMVTWSMPGNDFFFLQDVSGGIRVRYDPRKTETPSLGKYLEIDGVTASGGQVPEVVFRSMIDRGSMSPPEPRRISFEQAITGREDGQWVEMRGFIQRTVSDGDWRWIYVTTPAGEFVGHLQSPVNVVANPGSLIRVQGVCETTTNQLGQSTGVMLRVPFLHSVRIEEDAPTDAFDLPQHPISGLRQLSGVRDMTRVRVVGAVLHAVPGRVVYVEEGEAGLQVFTRQDERLAPGEVIEIVGILGREGLRMVLREAVYRRTRRTEAPRPVFIADPSRLMPALDARLVTVRGRVIDVFRQRNQWRLTLQTERTLFEAVLTTTADQPALDPRVGAGLELTGIYQLVFDDARQTRGFALQLRTPADLVVFQRPRLWTLQRALAVCAVLGGAVLLGVAWITALRRRVHQQTRQLRDQMERQSQLEAEVQRAARLESLGALAGGIAHDFNNLLTIIMGNLGLALLDGKLSESTRRCLHEIERGTSRARALTRQLLTFAKGGEPLRAPVALPDIVRLTADRARQGSAVRCTYRFASDLWLAYADKDQLAQVVHNLVANALEAMPAGGDLRIELANDELAEAAHRTLRPGRYVRLTVSDSGEGIRPEVLPRIFDPYFSTRKAGSGLGLATVYSIVKRHEGAVEVDSTPGAGSTFTLWVPAADGSVPEPEPAPEVQLPLVPPARKTARVLLLEDEASIQQVLAEVLGRIGVAVKVTADGAATIKEFTLAVHRGAPFDLLILDLTVPGGMGGREVIELVRKLDPQVPAIVSSGYSSDPVMANFGQYGFQAMVQKPYEIGQLIAVVERLLAGRRPAGETPVT